MIVVFDAHCRPCSGWVRFRFAARLFGRSATCMVAPRDAAARFLA